ncbi:hypothetical protein HYPGJ_30193 [Hyphomicrobium sp. GJ21]|nr:hypothetical protein HYPGJ_30193 [Hyphomicrobium sp. GJ21]
MRRLAWLVRRRTRQPVDRQDKGTELRFIPFSMIDVRGGDRWQRATAIRGFQALTKLGGLCR